MSQENVKNDIAVIEVNGCDAYLAQCLLQSKLIAYHDDQYEVTSGIHEILMKLLHDKKNGEIIIFYVHVPYAYPMPTNLENAVKLNLEEALKQPIRDIKFVNVGAESHKKDLQFRISLGED
jgi:hypothetical protein